MPVDLNELYGKSPYLYHLTYRQSLKRIERVRRLESAAYLMKAGGQLHLLRRRREVIHEFMVDGDLVVLTDQEPIIEANIFFDDGWLLEDLIEAINRRVFFWRGPPEGLLAKDKNQFDRYSGLNLSLIFLRARFNQVTTANLQRGPEICKYNSGAPRQVNGQRSPRGPATFSIPSKADFGIKDIREVVFKDFIDLPSSTEWSEGTWEGPWQPLFSNANLSELCSDQGSNPQSHS